MNVRSSDQARFEKVCHGNCRLLTLKAGFHHEYLQLYPEPGWFHPESHAHP